MVHIRAEGKGAGREAGRERGGDAQGNEDGTGGGEARAQGGRSQATGTRNAEVGAAQDAEGALVRAEERQAGRNEMGKRKWRPAEDGVASSEERAAGTADRERGRAEQSHGASDGARTPRNAAAVQHSRETQLNTEYTRKTEGVKRRRTDADLRRGVWEESAPTRAARWKRYPKLAAVSGAWVTERQEPGRRRQEAARAATQYAERYPAAMKEKMRKTEEGWIAERLPWPHTWKKRKKAADEQEKARQTDEAARRRAEGESARAPRSEARSHLRRTRAQSEEYSYDQNPRKRRRQGVRAGTKRRIEYIEDMDKRRGALRLTIRAGPEGIRRITGQRSEEHEAA